MLTQATFASPLWALCSLWLKSVIFNPIKPIYDEYKPQSSQRTQSPHQRFFRIIRNLINLCESSVIFVLFVVNFRLSQSNQIDLRRI